MDKENQLKSLLPDIVNIVPAASDSHIRLLSLARIYVALYRLVFINGCDDEFGDRREWARKADLLFRAIHKKAFKTTNPELKCKLIVAMYTLSHEIDLIPDGAKEDICLKLTAQVLDETPDEARNNPALQIALFRCLMFYFYPIAEEFKDDKRFVFFQETIKSWAESLSEAGSWDNVSNDMALDRIEVMNRNSYMFLDERYDEVIRRAYIYYSKDVAMQPSSLYTLGRLYETAMAGNAYPVDREMATKVAGVMMEREVLFGKQSDEWVYLVSYGVEEGCEGVMEEEEEFY